MWCLWKTKLKNGHQKWWRFYTKEGWLELEHSESWLFPELGGEKENKGCLGLGGGREAPKPPGAEGSHFISQGETQATGNTLPVVLIPERPNYCLKIIAWMWSESKGCLSKRVWNPEAF